MTKIAQFGKQLKTHSPTKATKSIKAACVRVGLHQSRFAF